MPPFWALFCATGVHEIDATGGGQVEIRRHQMCGLLGRPPDYWSEQRGEQESYGKGHASAAILGFYNQPEEIEPGAHTATRILGLYSGHEGDAFADPNRETSQIQTGLQRPFEESGQEQVGETTRRMFPGRQTQLSSPGSAFLPASPAKPDQASKKCHERAASQGKSVGSEGSIGQGSHGRSGMVDKLVTRVEREGDTGQGVQPGLWRRRLGHRVWWSRALEQKEAKTDSGRQGLLDGGRSKTVNKHKGAVGGRKSGESNCKVEKTARGDDKVPNRLKGGVLLPQFNDRKGTSPVSYSRKDIGVPGIERDHNVGGTHLIERERSGRPAQPGVDQPKRLEAEQGGVQPDRAPMGTVHDRLVRGQKQRTDNKILFLGTGSSSDLRGRAPQPVETGKRVREPPFLNNRCNTQKTQRRRKGDGYCSSNVAPAGVVAHASRDAGGLPDAPPEKKRSVSPTSKERVQLPPRTPSLESSRVQDIRESLEIQGVSEESSKIIMASIKRSTQSSYEYAWKRWKRFCTDKGVSIFNPTIPQYLEYLTEEFKRNGKGSAVTHAMTVVGGAVRLVGNIDLNSTGQAQAFRQSVITNSPAKPRYDSTWPIELIWKWILALGPNEKLDLELLRKKTIILLRVDMFARASDLARLYRSEISFHKEFWQYRIHRPKEWRPASLKACGEWSQKLKVFKHERRPMLCSFRTLQCWLERTEGKEYAEDIEVEGRRTRGVICSIAKDKKKGQYFTLVEETIAKLTEKAMREAKVDPKFKSQSIRGAASSAAYDNGLPMPKVLEHGRWSSASMWKKFYYRSNGKSRKDNGSMNVADILRDFDL